MKRTGRSASRAGRTGERTRRGASTDGATEGRFPSRRERERVRRRMEILEAAEELFARFGYEKACVKAIAERAELSVGQIYNHFKGKEEIFRELMETRMNELHEQGEEACGGDDPPMRRLRCRIEAGIDHFRRHRDFMIIYHNENPLALHGMVMEEIRRNREIIAGLFAEAIARGDVPREDPDELATVLIGAIHGLLDVLAECEDDRAFDAVPALIERVLLQPLERRGRRSRYFKDVRRKMNDG
jgi:AcrR family transcriptional regulator